MYTCYYLLTARFKYWCIPCIDILSKIKRVVTLKLKYINFKSFYNTKKRKKTNKKINQLLVLLSLQQTF